MLRRLFAIAPVALAALACTPDRAPPLPPREPARPPVAFRTAAPSAPSETPTEHPSPDAARALPERIARCVARLDTATPRELAGALDALQLPSLLEDACRLDAAPSMADPSVCTAIASSAVREACLTRVALATATPERCPATPGLLGREPVCVALAARSPALCAAAPGTDRARCLALVHVDAAACARLDPAFRSACLRDLRELAPWLQRRRGDALDDARVTLDRVDPAADAGPLQTWSLRAHRRGAWLDESGRLWLVDPALGWPRATAAAGDEPVVAVRIATRGVSVGREVEAEARVILPDALALDTDDHSARATATFATVPTGRGARYAVTVTVTGVRAGLASTLVLHGEGFVRDVVSATSLRSW